MNDQIFISIENQLDLLEKSIKQQDPISYQCDLLNSVRSSIRAHFESRKVREEERKHEKRVAFLKSQPRTRRRKTTR